MRIKKISIGAIGTIIILYSLLFAYFSYSSRNSIQEEISSITTINVNAVVPNFRSINIINNPEANEPQIYRSGRIGALTETQQLFLKHKNIGLVIDIRSNKEATEFPDQNLEGIKYINIPLVDQEKQPSKMKMIFSLHRASQFWVESMQSILDENPNSFKVIIDEILALDKGKSVLIHCTGGKNRTGIVAAILIKASGGTNLDVVNDYTKSNHSMEFIKGAIEEKVDKLHFIGLKIEAFYPFYYSRPIEIEKVLNHIEDKYGSVDNYLTRRVGVTTANLNKLQEIF